jgi:hypothetical protein
MAPSMVSSETPVMLPKDQMALHGLIWGFAMLPDQRIQKLMTESDLDQAFRPAGFDRLAAL